MPEISFTTSAERNKAFPRVTNNLEAGEILMVNLRCVKFYHQFVNFGFGSLLSAALNWKICHVRSLLLIT